MERDKAADVSRCCVDFLLLCASVRLLEVPYHRTVPYRTVHIETWPTLAGGTTAVSAFFHWFACLQVGQKYHVLCVLTDGIINDMVSHYVASIEKSSSVIVLAVFRIRVLMARTADKHTWERL